MPDQVTIRVPPSTSHIGLIRATASGLAALVDMTYDRIMDLHIAIDEVCSRIVATANTPPETLEFSFELEKTALRIEAHGDAPMKSGAEFLTEWSGAILRSVTDDLQLSVADGGPARVTFLVRGEAS